MALRALTAPCHRVRGNEGAKSCKLFQEYEQRDSHCPPPKSIRNKEKKMEKKNFFKKGLPVSTKILNLLIIREANPHQGNSGETGNIFAWLR